MVDKCRTVIKGIGREHKAVVLFAAAMAVYYGWRMFALDPWYDELYTYYSFISRGPIYAAIHWPVPNNHVFYSVLSGFFMIFGNPYIALRGISFLFSVGNLILMYYLASRFFTRKLSLGCAALYASFYQVNYLSVQGRGYTLAIGFYLLALIMLYHICVKPQKQEAFLPVGEGRLKRLLKGNFPLYAVFSLSLTGGLYAIPSNLYWVLPVCLAGGLYLLFQKEMGRLLRLIISSLIAAFNTFCLYSLIWLAIGSNLLSKTEGSGYFGIYQVDILLEAPFKAWQTGMKYMLDTPYVQSIDRGTVITGFFDWLVGLMNLFYSSWGLGLTLLLIVSLFLCPWLGRRSYLKKEEKELFLYVCLGSMLWSLPIILIVQSVQPYYRVFTFLGVPLALLLAVYLKKLIPQKGQGYLDFSCLLFLAGLLVTSYYNEPYADRESEIRQIWELAEIREEPESFFYVDDYQKYVLQFYWGYRPRELPLQEAQYILVPREVEKEDFEEYSWPVLYPHAALDWKYLEGCELVYTTSAYRLYKKR